MALQTLQSVVELLPHFGERQAVGVRGEFGVRWWSYTRLYDEAIRAAMLLRDRGLPSGERLVLWAPNCPEWVAVVLGAALRGLVVVPADAGASPAHVQRIANEVAATLVMHGPDQDVTALAQPTLALPQEPCDRALAGWARVAVPIEPDAAALILFTSGTTQHPKGVILTHRNVVSQLEAFRGWRWVVRLIPLRRLLVLAPLSHSQGLMLGMGVPLSLGLTTLYTPEVDPAHLIRAIRDNRVSLLATVPRVLHVLGRAISHTPSGGGATLDEVLRRAPGPVRRLVQARRLHGLLGDQFRVVLVGGAALPLVEERFWKDRGCLVIQGYGLTETAAIVSINNPFSGTLGSIGRALPNQTVRIAEDGELLVQGATVSPGYFSATSPEGERSPDGFLRTGDLARRDARDRLYFIGRKKEMIVTGEGHNIYPQDIEAVLDHTPGVIDAVVLGLHNDGHEEVHAVLVLQAGASAAAVVRQANAALEPHQTIRSWTVWDGDFPRTSLLKVKRDDVAAALRAKSVTGDAHRPPADDLIALTDIVEESDRSRRLALIARYVAQAPAERVTDERTRLVEDLGLRSLDIAELLTLLERQEHVSLDTATIPRDASLDDLRQVLERSSGRRAGPPGYRRPPAWQDGLLVRLPRSVMTGLIVPAWFSARARLTVRGTEHLTEVRRPFILAASNHHHAMDVMAIHCALPRRLREDVLLVSSSFAFREYFEPPPGTSRRQRWLVGAAFHFGLSLFFPFVVVAPQGTTRQGLFELGRLVDRGYSPIIFPEGWPDPRTGEKPILAGIGPLAVETQLPLVPVHLRGNERIGFQPRRPRDEVTVTFGPRMTLTPNVSADSVRQQLKEAFARLAMLSGDGRDPAGKRGSGPR